MKDQILEQLHYNYINSGESDIEQQITQLEEPANENQLEFARTLIYQMKFPDEVEDQYLARLDGLSAEGAAVLIDELKTLQGGTDYQNYMNKNFEDNRKS